MKYKIIAAVLAAVFAVGMLAACQREKEPYPSYYDNTTSQPTASDLTGDATEPETTLPSTEFEPETSRPTEETAPSKSESESNTEPKTNSAVEPKNYSFKTLMLVNPTHSVPDGYVESITLEKVQGSYVMDSRCAEPMRDMIAAAKRDGITLQLCSTFRTYETQKKLYENRIKILMNRDSSLTYEQAAEKAKTINAYPGTSEHELGLAADIVTPSYQILNSDFDKTATFKWLKTHCAEYGFILRYPKEKQDITRIIYEPWHYRYVGQEDAKKIMDSGLTLEEYLGILD